MSEDPRDFLACEIIGQLPEIKLTKAMNIQVGPNTYNLQTYGSGIYQNCTEALAEAKSSFLSLAVDHETDVSYILSFNDTNIRLSRQAYSCLGLRTR